MGNAKGMLMTCDRCGKSHFRRLTGGFTHGEDNDSAYEKAEGWSYVLYIGDLCPECWNSFMKIVNDFAEQK